MSQHVSSAPRRSDVGVNRVTAAYATLLRLCPPAFRADFGAEATQVFRQLCRDAASEHGMRGTLAVFIFALSDLIAGAVQDHLALLSGALYRSWVMSRMRSSAILVFCAYIAFVVVGMGFQKSTEDVVKSSVPTAHPGVALAYYGVMGGAVLALLATLVGGLPIAFAALRQALGARRWGIVALFAVPPISLAIWLGWTFTLLDVIFPANKAAGSASPMAHAFLYSWIGIFVLAAVASVTAVSVAIARSEIRPELYRFALTPEIGVALGMLVTVGAIVVWAVQLQSVAPSYLSANDGPVGLQASLGEHVIVQIALMLVASLIVIAGIVRGYTDRRLQAV